MRILITGSSGFIGSHLSKFLKSQGIEVIHYDIRRDPLENVRDIHQLQKRLDKVVGVVHLAAISRVKTGFENPLACISTNVGGTANVLEAIRNSSDNPWIIFGSSREVFGEPENLPVKENFPRKPINIYGMSKRSGEDFCKAYSENYGLKTRILRFSNVYTGPMDHLDRVIPKFIFQAFKGDDLYINGSGEEMIFDFTYIDDIIQGIWECIQEIGKGKKLFDDFNLGIGIPVSLKELAELIVEKAGTNSKIHYRDARAYDVDKFYADPTKAKKILNYHPQVNLKEGLDIVIGRFKKAGLL